MLVLRLRGVVLSAFLPDPVVCECAARPELKQNALLPGCTCSHVNGRRVRALGAAYHTSQVHVRTRDVRTRDSREAASRAQALKSYAALIASDTDISCVALHTLPSTHTHTHTHTHARAHTHTNTKAHTKQVHAPALHTEALWGQGGGAHGPTATRSKPQSGSAAAALTQTHCCERMRVRHAGTRGGASPGRQTSRRTRRGRGDDRGLRVGECVCVCGGGRGGEAGAKEAGALQTTRRAKEVGEGHHCRAHGRLKNPYASRTKRV